MALLLCATTASATPETEAESLVQSGIDLRREHHDEEALAQFRKAWALVKTPRIRAQIALAQQALGHWVDAETDLLAALDVNTDPWVQKNHTALEEALAKIAEHLGWLAVDCNVKGAKVTVDGALRGTTPIEDPIRVAAGTVVVEVVAPGYLPVKRPVLVIPKLHARERFLLVSGSAPTAAPTPQPAPTPADRPQPAAGDTQRWLGYGIGAVGVIGVGLGTYFGAVVLSKKASRDQHCNDQGCADQAGLDYDHDARTAATRSTIAFIAGGVALAAGVGLVLTAPRGGTDGHALRVVPAVGLKEGGLRLETRW